ncbi:MAG: hypothetical protein HOH32_14930 [Rhodobacteraceae bacterium]|mgnify:FL=1|jgi:uncharacterized protein|nr:hypothetical protein [Paracoccaceae bacterium]MDE2634226.1 Mth938-like domain-containing protein [Paracoccaceae bacterium]
MQMNEMQFSEGVPVDGYGPGFFRIAGQVVQGPICLGPTGLCAWRGYDNLDPLMALANAVDVIFVGTGAEIAFLPDPVRQCLEKASFGVEPMSSPAACRTYNVLLSEGRRVALAALPVATGG